MPEAFIPWPEGKFIDYIFGRYQWWRKWRGGYWYRSDLTEVWWKHKDRLPELTEDYRKAKPDVV